MEIVEEKLGFVMALALRGRLDATSSKAFEDRLLALIDAGESRLILDLEQLAYVSSVGLRVLILAAKRLKTTNGAIVVCSLQPTIQQVFEIAGFTTLFAVYGTRDDALAAVN